MLILGLLVAQPTLSGPRRTAGDASPERLRQHVEAFARDFVPRTYADTQNMARCRSYLTEQFRACGAAVTAQVYTVSKIPCANIVALIPGASPERVVIGAHYDAVATTPGADDNASGTAGLLELARLLQGSKPACTIELVAYCTEEPPCFGGELMGSYQHAKALSDARIPIRAMIALEMIGCFSDAPDSQTYPVPAMRLFYPSRADFIGVVGDMRQWQLVRRVTRNMKRVSAIPVCSVTVPDFIPGIDYSDHRSYWAFGFPAIMVTDTAFYRNFRYHTAEDTSDRLDYRRMALTVDAVREAVSELAGVASLADDPVVQPQAAE